MIRRLSPLVRNLLVSHHAMAAAPLPVPSRDPVPPGAQNASSPANTVTPVPEVAPIRQGLLPPMRSEGGWSWSTARDMVWTVLGVVGLIYVAGWALHWVIGVVLAIAFAALWLSNRLAARAGLRE